MTPETCRKAVTNIGGVVFASLLTLVAAPLFYFVLFARSAKGGSAKGTIC